MYDDMILLCIDESKKDWFDLRNTMGIAEHGEAFIREMWRCNSTNCFMTCLPVNYLRELHQAIIAYFKNNDFLSPEDIETINHYNDGP